MTDELKVFRRYVQCGAPPRRDSRPAGCYLLFVPKKKENCATTMALSPRHGGTRWHTHWWYTHTPCTRMERRCCLLNIIGAHSLDSILLPSDLRLRLFCLILRPLCRPMPALAFSCYAAVLLYIPYWETLKQATIYFDSTMDSNPF